MTCTTVVLVRFYGYVSDISAHICHIAYVGGIEFIWLGSDFDGIDNNLELKNCGSLGRLERELKQAGFHEGEIDKIFYQNVLAFYKELL